MLVDSRDDTTEWGKGKHKVIQPSSFIRHLKRQENTNKSSQQQKTAAIIPPSLPQRVVEGKQVNFSS